MEEKKVEEAIALIQAAAEAVERARAFLVGASVSLPSFPPTDLGTLLPADQESARDHAKKAYRASPEWAAVHYCLMSSSCSLAVSQLLIQQPLAPHSPAEVITRQKKMVDEAKAAGRAAYRSALILCDPDTH